MIGLASLFPVVPDRDAPRFPPGDNALKEQEWQGQDGEAAQALEQVCCLSGPRPDCLALTLVSPPFWAFIPRHLRPWWSLVVDMSLYLLSWAGI